MPACAAMDTATVDLDTDNVIFIFMWGQDISLDWIE